MDARNCPRCGKVFTKVRASVCPSCEKEVEIEFENVREYVKENPNSSIGDVSSETGVSVKRIMQYVRDGKLEVSTGMSKDVGCSNCGAPILSGRFCEKCAKEVQAQVLQGKPQQEIKLTGKMHSHK